MLAVESTALARTPCDTPLRHGWCCEHTCVLGKPASDGMACACAGYELDSDSGWWHLYAPDTSWTLTPDGETWCGIRRLLIFHAIFAVRAVRTHRKSMRRLDGGWETIDENNDDGEKALNLCGRDAVESAPARGKGAAAVRDSASSHVSFATALG